MHATFGGILEEPIVSVSKELDKLDGKHPVYAELEADAAASDERLPETEARLVSVEAQIRTTEEVVPAGEALLSFETVPDPGSMQPQDH